MRDYDKKTFIKLISEQTGHEIEEIKETSRFREDLTFDSLDMIELIMAVEEKLNYSIPDGAFDESTILTVADAIKLIDEKSAEWYRR